MAQNLWNLSKSSFLPQIRRSISTSVPKTKDAATAAADEIGHYITPSTFQKRILVFAKKYENMDAIPIQVPSDKWNKARDVARVKVSNYAIVLTLVGALGMIISGKNAAIQGESVEEMRMQWHRDYEEKHKEELKNSH